MASMSAPLRSGDRGAQAARWWIGYGVGRTGWDSDRREHTLGDSLQRAVRPQPVCDGSPRCVPRLTREQVVEDPCILGVEGEVAAGQLDEARTRDLLDEAFDCAPWAVLVISTVPPRHSATDVVQRSVPLSAERQVLVDPSIGSLAKRFLHRDVKPFCQFGACMTRRSASGAVSMTLIEPASGSVASCCAGWL